MTGRLEGKVAIVTGAARGQGEAEARRFVAEGARVVVTDVLDELGEAVADSLGDAAIYQHLDVSNEDEWQATVALAEETFGPVTVLVNNAGILLFAAVDKISYEQFERVMKVNVFGSFLGIKTVVPSMRRAGGGSIINISSNGGMNGLPYLNAYVTSKFAVRGMAKSAAAELGPQGIRVNVVHPGGIDTEMSRPPGATEAGDDAPFYKRLAIPRKGTVDEVANLVLFLASDEASYCCGGEYTVDGGSTGTDNGVLEQ